jgi:hypothetical protein
VTCIVWRGFKPAPLSLFCVRVGGALSTFSVGLTSYDFLSTMLKIHRNTVGELFSSNCGISLLLAR